MLFILCVCMCICMSSCVPCARRSPRRPEEGLRSPATGVRGPQAIMRYLMASGSQAQDLCKSKTPLNHLAKSPSPQIKIFVDVCMKCGWSGSSWAGPYSIPSRSLHLQTHSISAPKCQRENEWATQDTGKKITFAKWIVFHPLNECDTFFASGIHTEGLWKMS